MKVSGNHIWILTLFLTSVFIFSKCSSSSLSKSKVNLPFYGHKNVVNGDTVYHTIPDWQYITQDSTVLSSSSIKNKIWVADFIFASCQNICSPMTFAMKKVNDSLKNVTDSVVFLTFTIDPTHDSPSVLKAYAKAHDALTGNWYFLTGGEQEEINQFAIKQFLVFATADKDAPGGFAHSRNFIVVDRNQHVRGLYDGLTEKGRTGCIQAVRSLIHSN